MRLLLAVVVAAAATGCAAQKSSAPASRPAGGPAPVADVAAPAPAPDGRGYCDLPAMGICGEIPADAYSDGEQLCADNGGSWTTSGCPTAGVVGYCTNPERGGGAKVTLYSSRYPDAESARADKCVDEGDVFEPAY